MSLQVEKLEKNMAKLTIEAPADEFEKAVEKSYQKNKNRMSVPGFRKGKVPRKMLEKMYGAQIFFEDAINDLIPQVYSREVTAAEDLEIVSQPKIEVTQAEAGQSFIFTAEVALKPAVELGQYKGLAVEKDSVEVTDEDVAAELEKVRKENQQIPIIFLTASDEEVSIIRGLDSGGDDYITKPFKLGELCSRIRALLRRAGVSKSEKNTSMECGDITIDLLGSRATLKGKALDLTSAEYRLLCLLVRNANRVVTRDIILNELWDDIGNFVDDNTLSVYVRRLREKVETNPSHPEHLITIRGFGYQWKEVSI